jgi:hypothetical protein
MKIIYINENGGVSVIHPTPEALELYSIAAIALKDVPAGVAFKIVEDEFVPDTREARTAWEIKPEDLTDGVGAESNEFKEN